MCVITAYGVQCLVVICRWLSAVKHRETIRRGKGMLHDRATTPFFDK